MNYFSLLLPFLVACGVTVFATPLSIKWIKKKGLIDDPKKHIHPGIIHKKPIPRGGGLPLFIGTWVAIFLFVPISLQIGALFFASLLLLVVGLLDDKWNAHGKDISPYIRFFINIIAAGIVVLGGINIHFITNPFGEGVLFFSPLIDNILSIIWLVWIMNMLNWSKGVDGQMPGIVAISAIIIGVLSLKLTMNGEIITSDALLSFIIAGSAIGFLFFNFYPAKIFPGYGATSLYLLLGVVAMLSSTKLATAILVMGVPMVDALFTIGRRILARHSPFKGDKKHLHHLLLQMGFDQRRIALFYWAISAILGILALLLESRSKFFVMIMVGVITAGGLLFLHAITKKTNEKTIT